MSSLSVIFPNYNHARYLPESLGAIVSQSLPPAEVLVTDDASTDGSVAIIESFAQRYPFVKLLRNEKNIGVIASVRRALEHASGDFLAFEAADDKILPGLYEKSMAMFARHPQAGLCTALARVIGPDSEDLGVYDTCVISEKECYVPPEHYLAMYRKYDNWIVPYAVIMKRSAFLEAGGFDPALGPLCDSVMNREIAMRHGVCFIPEPLACWRRVPGGYAHQYSQDVDRILALFDPVVKRAERPRGGKPPLPDEIEYVRLWQRRSLIQFIWELNQRDPGSYEQIRRVGARLPAPTWIDRAYLAGLPLFSKMGRFPTKLYHFIHQAPAERRRILRHKMRTFFRRFP